MRDKKYLDLILKNIHERKHLNEWFEYTKATAAVGGEMIKMYKKCLQLKCRKIPKTEKSAKLKCDELCYVASSQKAISLLNSAKSKCKTARKPEKCIAKIDKDISRHKKNIIYMKKK